MELWDYIIEILKNKERKATVCPTGKLTYGKQNTEHYLFLVCITLH